MILVIGAATMPYSTEPVTFLISTQDTAGVNIESCEDCTITTTIAGTMTSGSVTGNSDNVSATGSVYTFKATGINPIPEFGSLFIIFPTDAAFTGSIATCTGAIAKSFNGNMDDTACTVDDGTAQTIQFQGLWTIADTTGTINVDITDWTNPSSAIAMTFTIATYDSTNTYIIDSVDVVFTPEPLTLTIHTYEPLDSDWGCNDYPEYYDIHIETAGAIAIDYEIVITLDTAHWQLMSGVTSCDALGFED